MGRVICVGLCIPLLVVLSVCQSEFDVGVGGQQQATFGQEMDDEKVKESKADKINTTEKRAFLYHSKDGKLMAVYDELFAGSTILTLRSYLTSLGQDSWLFNNYDPDDINKQRACDNVPWVNYRDPVEFNKMLVSKTLVKAICDLTGEKEEWFPHKVTGKVIRRGDHTKVVADASNPNEFSVLLYLNSIWGKNCYGELYFFDDDREIMHGVTPRPGRVIIWDSSILRLTRPPSVSVEQGQVLLHITYSKSKQKMLDEHEKWTSFWNDKRKAKDTWYLPDYRVSSEKLLVPDVEKHVVANFSTEKGEKIYVCDDLFPKDLLDHMQAHILKYGTYYYDESNHVQWIARLDMKLFLKSLYWKIIHAGVKFASGSSEWFPYQVRSNLIRNADHNRIHLDVNHEKEKEWTFLVYLTPNWTRNYYGETTYFRRNGDDTEVIAVVRPRYGRAVIFQGQIPHSARPSSPDFTGARLSLVTKLQVNEFEGRKKNLEEEFKHFKAHAGAIEKLELMAQFGDTMKHMKQMKAIKDKIEAEKHDKEFVESKSVNEADGSGSNEVQRTAVTTDKDEQEGTEAVEKVENEGGNGDTGGGEDKESDGGEQEGSDEYLSLLVQSDASHLEAPGEEEEERDPDVAYVKSELQKIKMSGSGNAESVAKLYDEMKRRGGQLFARMSERFPTLL